MDHWRLFPDKEIAPQGVISHRFLDMGIGSFHAACEFVHRLPYGYNSDRDDLEILFKEGMGSCTTKHAVIATLAQELSLPIFKRVCIYAMTEEIVAGTNDILKQFQLPYVPMIHCYLSFKAFRVDLTEGNHNGKQKAIDELLYSEQVTPNISAKNEYLIYRQALKMLVDERDALQGIAIKKLLQAREQGLVLLKANLNPKAA